MKILFLDVDGVLNNTYTFARIHRAWKESGEPTKVNFGWPLGHLDETLIANLNPIVEQTHCNIVLSSSWRVIAKIPDFREWMAQKGFHYAESIIDRTRRSVGDDPDARGNEIKDWLTAHPEVTSYVILDDDCFDIFRVHPNNFVHTNGNDGLTNERAQAAIAILNK
jgi:hypothetical protein